MHKPSAQTPHGPCRRGPASRLPYATRRRGPSPSLRTGPTLLLRLARARFAHHRPPLPANSVSAPLRTPLPALPATCFACLPSAPSPLTAAPSPPLRRSSPASSSRWRPASLTPSVAGAPSALPLPASARHVLGSPPPAASPHSCPPPRCPRRRHAPPQPRRPCGLRPSQASAPRRPRCPTTADATARASGSVLRMPALSSVRTVHHSIAVAAPLRRLLPRSFPFACTFGLSFLTAWRGLWFSHPTHQRCRPCHAHPCPLALCANTASGCPALFGSSVCRTDTRSASCPWPCRATLVLHRYTGDTRFSLPVTGPTHDRHALTIVASAPAAAFVPIPCTPGYGSRRRHPRPGTLEQATYWARP